MARRIWANGSTDGVGRWSLIGVTADKVDFLSVTDRDGELSVEMPVAALSKLVKAKAELKARKGERKADAAGHVSALQAERDAHTETQAALAKAERRIKALTKKLEGATASSDSTGAASKVGHGSSLKAAKTAAAPGKASGQGNPKPASSARSADAPEPDASVAVGSIAPSAPKKVSRKKAVAQAAEAVVAPEAPAEGPAALH